MTRPQFRSPVLCLLGLAVLSAHGIAAETGADLLPPSTVLYAEIEDPSALMQAVLNHPYTANIQKLDAYQEAIKDPQYIGFMFGLRFVEAQLGMKWQQALTDLSVGGVTIGFDAEHEGAVVLLKGASAEKLTSLKDKFLTLARKDAKSKGKPDPFEEKEYRGVTAYRADKMGFLTHDDWLLITNTTDLAKSIVDAMLDGRNDSLANEPTFQQAQQTRSDEGVAWGFVNVAPFRESGDEGLRKLFSGQADDPGGELILGGLLEAFKQTQLLTASLHAEDGGLSLSLKVPFDRTSVPEAREHFFGPEGTGHAGSVPQLDGELAHLTVYRNVSEMWLRAGDLFDGKVNDNLAQADATLTTLFSGKDFAEDILGALEPQFRIIAARQTYVEYQPIPAIKLPAFALMAEMKQPEVTTPEFRRIFQSFIGFLNIVGSMNGNPQLDLGMAKFPEGELISATFVPDINERDDQAARIQFNFSPTLAFAGNKVILGSTTSIAQRLAAAEQSMNTTEEPEDVINTLLSIDAEQLHDVLQDNASHLVAQNMLKEGHTKEEAEQQIGTLLSILNLFDGAALELKTNTTELILSLSIAVKQ